MTAELVDINTGEIPERAPLGICPECKKTAFADLVAALGKLHEPEKGGKAAVSGRGTHTYLTLPDLLGAVRGPLAEHHLAVMQEVVTDERGVTVVSVLLHASGYAFRSPALTLRSGPGPQDIGSASTYGRRYTLAAMVGLAGAEDDDAQQASRRPPTDSAPPRAPLAGGADTRGGPASDKSRKLMWTLLRKAGMTDDEVREYVAAYLHIDTDWHTENLNQLQVSGVIHALQADQQTPPPKDDDGRLPGT